MSLDLAALGRTQLGGLVDDVVERSVDLADVVKECDPLHAVLAALVQVRCFGNDQGVLRNAPDVCARCWIVRVDCL